MVTFYIGNRKVIHSVNYSKWGVGNLSGGLEIGLVTDRTEKKNLRIAMSKKR